MVVFMIVAIVTMLFVQREKEPEPKAEKRIPYSMGADYLAVQGMLENASKDKILVLGDSVVWGHYVGPHETLSHYLNELGGRDRFINAGINGIHPAALMGLVEHYGKSVENRRVVVNYNFLWMSSAQHDLQMDEEFAFNHQALVPQFVMDIPCYRASVSDRLGHVARRYMPSLNLASHWRITYFGSGDLSSWTVENPYSLPTREIVYSPETSISCGPPAEPDWVEADSSLQWACFQRTLQILRKRGNDVFVLVGPFNEHMLTKRAREVFWERQLRIEDWLRINEVPFIGPPPLRPALYADTSHPVAEGYKALAMILMDDEDFLEFIDGEEAGFGGPAQ
jgi:lysophospholipase L1-like esterase